MKSVCWLWFVVLKGEWILVKWLRCYYFLSVYICGLVFLLIVIKRIKIVKIFKMINFIRVCLLKYMIKCGRVFKCVNDWRVWMNYFCFMVFFVFYNRLRDVKRFMGCEWKMSLCMCKVKCICELVNLRMSEWYFLVLI